MYVSDLAVLGYRASNNIGDPVQSFALLCLLGKNAVRHVVDRDNICNFTPRSPTTLLVNGWLGQRPEAFRLTSGVTAFFISVHISDQPGIYSRGPSMAHMLGSSPEMQDMFRRSQPVGARDIFTLRLLESLDIDAYFSGCLTLHLPPRDVRRGRHILAVNIDAETVDHLRQRLSRPIIATSNVSNGAWLSVEDITEESESYLDLIASSHCVVTSRLHAALPAVAMGVPTVFAPQRLDDPRFGGLLDFIPLTVETQYLMSLPSSVFEEPFFTGVRDPGELWEQNALAIAGALSEDPRPE